MRVEGMREKDRGEWRRLVETTEGGVDAGKQK